MTTASEIIQGLRDRPMSFFQWMVAGVCLAVNTFDGFDVLVMAFVAPAVGEVWGLSNTQIGTLFSAGLFGMMVGALTISPLADIHGRRTIVLGCLTIMTIGMLASAFTNNATELGAARFFTGIGIGGMLASLNTLVAEFASSKRRDLLLAVYGMGFAVGSIGGGLIASYLLAEHSWRHVFMFGGIMSAILVPIIFCILPESIEFLVTRQPKNGLPKLNKIFAKMKQPLLDMMPDVEKTSQPPVWAVFGPGMWHTTVMVCLAFAMIFSFNYFVANWTPKIVVDMGFSEQQGIQASIWVNAGGMGSGLLLGYLGGFFNMRILSPIFMMGAVIALVSASFIFEPFQALLCLYLAVGFFGLGASTSLYMIVPRVFPAALRATGTGVAIGIGRIGAIIGPWLPGLMIDAGWSRPVYFGIMAAPVVLCAVFVLMLKGLKDEKKAPASS